MTIPKQRELVTDREYRRNNANLALQTFAKGTFIVFDRGRTLIEWETRAYGSTTYCVQQKRWQVSKGQDFYPIWSRHWPHGGTACTALSQLVRWTQGRPVLPLSTFRWWAGDKCQLARDRGSELIDRLVHAQYPEHAHCVLCGVQLTSLDWWHLNNVSGPCCSWQSGCRQKAKE